MSKTPEVPDEAEDNVQVTVAKLMPRLTPEKQRETARLVREELARRREAR